MTISIRALRTRHRKAYRAMVLAQDAFSLIKDAGPASVGIQVTNAKDGAAQEFATTHGAIDRICNGYIEFSRKIRQWGFYHAPQRGRVDDHGIFHELGTPFCPTVGEIVMHESSTRRLPFDDASLADYRTRVADYHARLNKRSVEVHQQNADSGHSAAWAQYFSASEVEKRLWDNLLARAARGSRDELKQVCLHQVAVENAEFWRVSRMEEPKRSLDAVADEHADRASELVRAICKPTGRKSK